MRRSPGAILLALCAVLALISLSGCSLSSPAATGSTTTTQDPALLLGRWMDPARGTGYEFLAGKKLTSIIRDEEITGSYRVSGNKISMFVDDVSAEAAWKVQGATLTLTLEGLPAATFKRE